jgi:hypothetical protein
MGNNAPKPDRRHHVYLGSLLLRDGELSAHHHGYVCRTNTADIHLLLRLILAEEDRFIPRQNPAEEILPVGPRQLLSPVRANSPLTALHPASRGQSIRGCARIDLVRCANSATNQLFGFVQDVRLANVAV